MDETAAAAPNPARAKELSPATLPPPAFQAGRAEAAAFYPDSVANDRFMAERRRVRLAGTQQPPPLSRIMLARGHRFASTARRE
ncbi:MAG: hypothetical protein ACREC9_12900 [Methylocella sp.]